MSDFIFNFKEIVSTRHRKLYQKKAMYTGALMRKLLKIYKKVGTV